MPVSLEKPDALFRGITPVSARRVLKLFLEEKGDALKKWVVPCAGQFTVPEALVDFGVPPSSIVCSDITLFSSVLGYIASKKPSLDPLGFKPVSPRMQEALKDFTPKSVLEQAALILYAIKWTQLDSAKDFFRYQRLAFESDRQRIFTQYVDTMGKLLGKLGGSGYEIRDAFDHVQSVAHESEAAIWFNPPGYKGGYGKMFDAKGHYVWEAPAIAEIDPIKNSVFMAALTEAEATVLAYMTEGHALEGTPPGWNKCYTAINDKTRKRSYILCNKSVKLVVPVRKKETPLGKLYPLYDDREITAKSKISLLQCSKELALYYYDLFVRELGMVVAQKYYLFMIDGRVAGTCGFFQQFWFVKRLPVLYETFGLSMTSEKYARLGRLLMGAITCLEFKKQYLTEAVKTDKLFCDLKMLRTTCLTKYPESKKNRGLLKLVKRERMANGRFYLVYETEWHKRGYSDVVTEWVGKHAQHGRES
jgi:hypothetical protein